MIGGEAIGFSFMLCVLANEAINKRGLFAVLEDVTSLMEQCKQEGGQGIAAACLLRRSKQARAPFCVA